MINVVTYFVGISNDKLSVFSKYDSCPFIF